MKARNIIFRKSDLFSNISKRNRFDLIIFNPPYLPEQKGEPKHISRKISGGKKGFELLERFFSEVNDYLEKDGKILIVFSSLTNRKKVDEIIDKYGFQFVILSTSSIGFEKLFVYEIERTELLKDFIEKGLCGIQKFAKGRRGLIYKAWFKGKAVAVKTKLPERFRCPCRSIYSICNRINPVWGIHLRRNFAMFFGYSIDIVT